VKFQQAVQKTDLKYIITDVQSHTQTAPKQNASGTILTVTEATINAITNWPTATAQ